MVARVGIEYNGVFIGAMKFPDRKKPCLVVERGNSCVVIGSFNGVSGVDHFEEALRDLLNVGGSKDGSK